MRKAKATYFRQQAGRRKRGERYPPGIKYKGYRKIRNRSKYAFKKNKNT